MYFTVRRPQGTLTLRKRSPMRKFRWVSSRRDGAAMPPCASSRPRRPRRDSPMTASCSGKSELVEEDGHGLGKRHIVLGDVRRRLRSQPVGSRQPAHELSSPSTHTRTRRDRSIPRWDPFRSLVPAPRHTNAQDMPQWYTECTARGHAERHSFYARTRPRRRSRRVLDDMRCWL